MCNKLTNNKYLDNFRSFDIFEDEINEKFKFIYSMSVIHMFVLEEHRYKFLRFIYDHLEDDGIAFITSMGDGIKESKTDISKAFDKVYKNVQSADTLVRVTNTSCRIVSFDTLLKEVKESNLTTLEKFISNEIPGFNTSMCLILKK